MKKINFWNRDLLQNIGKKMNTAIDWWASIWQSLFPTASTSGIDSTSSTTTNTLTKRRGTKSTINLTFPTTIDYDYAMDLYYNRKPGYKLGAFFCYSIIAIPLTFMGFPHFDVEDWKKVKNKKWWEIRFKFYNEKMIIDKQDIQKLCHITGTVGVFPWFDSKAGFVKLYFIKSKYITDIYTNPDTQELTGIKTEIKYIFNWEDGKEYNFTEVKIYTKNQVKTIRTGIFPPGIRGTEIKRNPNGELPVFFTNDRERGEFEGHSDFQRIVPLVKAYADILLEAHEEVLNMKAKLIQKVENLNKWLQANGYNNVDEVSIENVDFVLNVGEETTDIIVPQHLIENHIKILNLYFWNIIETARIPEIFMGKNMSGNHASAGKQDKYGLAFVAAKQQQAHPQYVKLANIIIKLDAMAYNQNPPENIICTWDDFDSMTEVERAEVFDKWCAGFQKLGDNHGIDMQGIHAMLLQLTKGMITEDYKNFKKQVEEYGSLRAFLEQDYGGMKDFQQDDSDDNENGNGKGDNEELVKEIERLIRSKRGVV